MAAPLLEVRNLKKYFKTGRGMLHAVDDVSFTLDEGKTLGVVGESGCGKSTLGRTILHLLDATDGQILFEGRDITNPNRRLLSEMRHNMQIIFQDPFSSLNPRMSVSETIMEPMKLSGHMSKQEMEEFIASHNPDEAVGDIARRVTTRYVDDPLELILEKNYF